MTINLRHLETFDECERHYPDKTLKTECRRLRQRLLPSLREWTSSSDGVSPKYDTAANEKHRIKLLSEDVLSEVRALWCRIEEMLRPIYGEADGPANDLLLLICKGLSLFGSASVEVDASLTGLIERVCTTRPLPGSLASDLRAFKERFLPARTMRALRLKSLIRELVDVPDSGQCSLKKETLEFLHKHQKGFVEAMPGFKFKNRTERHVWEPEFAVPRFEYDPSLKRLFDHTVFRRFQFVRLA